MSLSRNAFPSSLRRPVESDWFVPASVPGKRKNLQGEVVLPRAASVLKSRFARLPQEPEDARMTGVTRSLSRRLLALNVRGSRLRTLSENAA